MSIGATPICMICRRYNDKNFDGMICKAYPKGIPDSIIYSEKDHRNPIDGDNGIQFERKDGVSDKEYKAITSVFNQ